MTLRPRDRIALVALLCLALAAGYYMLALKPEQGKVKSLNAAISSQQQAIAVAQQQIATGQAAIASLHANATQWAAVSLAVPAQADIPSLLRTLEHTADTEHVAMQSITLGGSPSATTQTTAASSSTSAGGATGVPIQLSFAGGYEALNNVIDRLEGLVTVSGGQVHASGPLLSVSSVQLSGSSKLTAQVSATIYQLSSSTAATAATTTGTGQ